jgi:hypothetical protein
MRLASFAPLAPLALAAAMFVLSPLGCAKGLVGLPGDGGAGGDGSGGTVGHGGTSAIGPTTGDGTTTTPDQGATTGAQTGAGGAGGDPSTATSGQTTSGQTNATSAVTSGPSTVTVGSGPSSPCDGTGQCQTCANCAQTSVCAAQSDACDNDPSFDCTFFELCIQPPCDNACINQCAQAYPNGAQLYSDLAECIVCKACYSDCMGGQSGCP